MIYGYSQGAAVANIEKQRLAEHYPKGTEAPDIDFVLSGDGNLPNGGILPASPASTSRSWISTFNGPEPTDTPFDTVVITRQYDFYADFPLYPLNLVADRERVSGLLVRALYALRRQPGSRSPHIAAYQDSTTGTPTYYFFETADLPLFGPLRTLGVPEQLIDVVEPFFKVIVDLGYDRSIPPGEPTPARLIPPLHPVKVAADLLTAIGEGINNAAALIGLPPLLSIPAPVTLAAPATETATSLHLPPGDVEGHADRNRAGDCRRDRRPSPTGDRRRERRPEPSGRP